MQNGEVASCSDPLTIERLPSCIEHLRWCSGGCSFPAGGGCNGFGECADGISMAVECPPGASPSNCSCENRDGQSTTCSTSIVEEVLACCAPPGP